MTLSKTLSSGLAAAVGLPLLLAEASPAGATASICDAITGNLVQNCGFEGGTYNSAAENYTPTVTPDDWLVNAPFANDPFSDGVRQYPNSGAYDLQIGPASANIAPGDPALWQTVTDKAGASYLATFYFYTTTGSNETIPNALFEAQINGVNYFSLPIGGIGPGQYRSYTKETFSFIGTWSDTLTFVAGTGNNKAPDWELDDVSVVPGSVPEPATWAMMLAGFVALGFASRRAGAGRSRLSEQTL